MRQMFQITANGIALSHKPQLTAILKRLIIRRLPRTASIVAQVNNTVVLRSHGPSLIFAGTIPLAQTDTLTVLISGMGKTDHSAIGILVTD